MTIEEKAKAYDEALKNACKIKSNCDLAEDSNVIETIETIFPELKESECEKIRKALLEMVHDTTGDELWVDYDIHKEEALAWLEKQGDKGSDPRQKYLDELLVADDIYQMATNDAMVNEAKAKAMAALSKMCIGELLGHEKQGEQNTTNKIEVEHKTNFKAGDFVVIQETTYQIAKIGACNVTLAANGRECMFDINVLRNAHKWTISDAKDGDVLAANNGVIILVNESRGSAWGYRLSYYCAVLYDGSFEPKEFHVNPDKFYPATKEQRKLLFQKMADAGYEWDAEKKELKKIEQKHLHGLKKSINDLTLQEAMDIVVAKYFDELNRK